MTDVLDALTDASRRSRWRGALNRALRDASPPTRRVLVFGEDVGTLGGVFRVTDGLAARFGDDAGASTPRWPRPASSAPRSGWP